MCVVLICDSVHVVLSPSTTEIMVIATSHIGGLQPIATSSTVNLNPTSNIDLQPTSSVEQEIPPYIMIAAIIAALTVFFTMIIISATVIACCQYQRIYKKLTDDSNSIEIYDSI